MSKPLYGRVSWCLIQQDPKTGHATVSTLYTTQVKAEKGEEFHKSVFKDMRYWLSPCLLNAK